MKTQVLARDSLKTQSKLFTVLYDLLLYVMIPIAFELSYVKIFQRSFTAYAVNDNLAMTRLIVYFSIQWMLGVLVRRSYISTTLKRVTLALMILMQVKEAFFEEVLFDMMVSMIMESGLMLLLFFKFANLVVLLKIAGFTCLCLGTLMSIIFHESELKWRMRSFLNFTGRNVNMATYRIQHCMPFYMWKGFVSVSVK